MANDALNILHDLFPSNIPIGRLYEPLLREKNIEVDLLRLDLIHPDISGNKIFKLKLFLEKALETNDPTIVTFGGAYSNHLAATAAACKMLGLNSIAFVRGEKSENQSHTLSYCEANGMKIQFISRMNYRNKTDLKFIEQIKKNISKALIIPEGGFSSEGAAGAASISYYIPADTYDYIGVSVGPEPLWPACFTHKSKVKLSGLAY